MIIHHSFAYAGPNRRSDLTVLEQEYGFKPDEAEQISQHGLDYWLQLAGEIDPGLAGDRPVTLSIRNDAERPGQRLATLYVHLALALQNAAGHLVSAAGLVSEPTDSHRVWFEYEEVETAQEAAEIACQTIGALICAETGSAFDQAGLARRIQQFKATSRSLAMPSDCRAILDAARARRIPAMRMDRPPYDPIRGDFRLRYNGLLRLGHGNRQHTVDGTFCVSRSEHVHALVQDRSALFERLAALSVPLPGPVSTGWCQSPSKAARMARKIGFPVTLRTSHRGTGAVSARALGDHDQVSLAATAALQNSSKVLVQPFVAGSTFKFLVAGDAVLDVFECDKEDESGWQGISGVHESLLELCTGLASTMGVGLMVVTVVTPDIQTKLEMSNGAVIDVELAPELDRLLATDNPLLKQAAEAFMDWIYPDPAKSRIPLAAVTGTNGKTTTTSMLGRIMTASGYSVGVASSVGSSISGSSISNFEDGYLAGHLSVLDNPDIDAAVLEATRGGAGSTGLGFDQCDVAVCINVSADHLNDVVGVRSVEELADLKRSIIERARHAVVLNADDAHCLAMVSPLEKGIPGRRIGLVSGVRSATELRRAFGPNRSLIVCENIDGQDWLVLHHHDNRLPVLAVDEIPMTFSGTARHNVSNAMHAALAAYLLGVEPEVISTGLRDLAASFDAMPGRLNFYRELPFDVCMDYAHNPAGVLALSEFTSRLEVKGKRIFCFSCNNRNSDDFIRETAAAAAGFFDHYICKNFSEIFERTADEGPQLLREGLLAAGVPSTAISCVADETEAIDAALKMARAGDLVVIGAGKRLQELWQQITSSKERMVVS